MSYVFIIVEKTQAHEAVAGCSGLAWDSESSEYKEVSIVGTDCVPLC
jgi:hypothetical protein